MEQLRAQLETFVQGRQLDDHFTLYCQLNNGAKALVRASQICIGFKNDLGIVVAGTKGSLQWRQEDPERITICLPNQPDRVYWRGAVTPGDGFLPKDTPADLMAEPNIPSGHPEAFHDAFARLHRCFEADVRKWKAGQKFSVDGSKYASVEDGWTGIAFVNIESSSATVRLAAMDANGNQVSSTTLTLTPGKKFVGMVDQPFTGNLRASMVCTFSNTSGSIGASCSPA